MNRLTRCEPGCTASGQPSSIKGIVEFSHTSPTRLRYENSQTHRSVVSLLSTVALFATSCKRSAMTILGQTEPRLSHLHASRSPDRGLHSSREEAGFDVVSINSPSVITSGSDCGGADVATIRFSRLFPAIMQSGCDGRRTLVWKLARAR